MDEVNEPQVSSKDISNIIEVVNQLLAFTGYPHKSRVYVDALIGMSRGSSNLTVTDETLAMYARSDAASVTKDWLTKWVQRERRKFDEWQSNIGVVFIECKPGGRDQFGYHKSRYKLPILEYARTVIEKARNRADWVTDPQFAIDAAAFEVADELKATPITIPSKRRFSGYYKTEVTTPMKTTIKKLERVTSSPKRGAEIMRVLP